MGRSWSFPVRFRVRIKDLGFCGAHDLSRKARCSCGCAFICEGSGQSFCFVSRPLLDPRPPSSARSGASILQPSCWAASFSWGQTHCITVFWGLPGWTPSPKQRPDFWGEVCEQMSKGTSSSCPSAGDQDFVNFLWVWHPGTHPPGVTFWCTKGRFSRLTQQHCLVGM